MCVCVDGWRGGGVAAAAAAIAMTSKGLKTAYQQTRPLPLSNPETPPPSC